MSRRQSTGPYLPSRDLPKIAVVRLTLELSLPLEPGFSPITISTWCIGPTAEQAIAGWRASYRGSGKLVATETLTDPHRLKVETPP